MTTKEFNDQLIEMEEGLGRFAHSLTYNHEEAKDLVQDTFLKALTYRDKFSDETNLKAWAYTIMKNTFINNYRRSKKINTIIDKTDDLYYLNLQSKNNVLPENEIFLQELQEGVKKIEDDQRVPFEMYNEGYKYKEIAEELDLSIGTVKSRIFFCRKRLMKNLQDFQN